MTPNIRKILIFGLEFLPLFLAFLWLYLLILPYYQPVVIGTANAVTERMSPPTRIESFGKVKMKSFVFTPQDGNRFMRSWDKTTGHLVFLSLALTPALLLATPTTIRTRFRLLGLGLPLVFVG